ncbi:hypothetical protein DJ68_03145 [Halorubrum sp. C3]|nr:hypothetical protein DJ68_03145 [Halorubrum sp. C3]
MTTAYIADTGVFVRCGGPDKNKFQRLRRALRQAGVSLRVPQRVYRRTRRIPRGLTSGMKPTNRDTNH